MYDITPGFDPHKATMTRALDFYKTGKLANRSDKVKALHDAFAFRAVGYFKDRPLPLVTRYDVEAWRDHLLKQPIRNDKWKTQATDTPKLLSPKTVAEMLVWFNAVYKYVDLPSPVKNVEKPRKTREQVMDETIQFYTDAEMDKILKAAKGTAFELPLQILLNTGCRPAELHGLRNTPHEIDRENKIVRFIDKRKRVRGIQLNVTPFNKAWDAIIKWIDTKGIEAGAYLFPRNDGWMLKRWHTVLKRAKMPLCRVHQLRHQFVKTCFYKLGRDLTWISKFCGHSTDIIYNTYSNLLIQTPKGKDDEVMAAGFYVSHPMHITDDMFEILEYGRHGKVKTVTISLDDFNRLRGNVIDFGKAAEKVTGKAAKVVEVAKEA